MRIYRDYAQARNEIERDLAELGRKVFAGYQSMTIDEERREDLTTMELTNYDYRIIRPREEDLEPFIPDQLWLDAEWLDRVEGIHGRPVNPGDSWLHRRSLWEPLLEKIELTPVEIDGVKMMQHRSEPVRKFSYTYSERLSRSLQVFKALEALVQNPHTRQAYVAIWDPMVDSERLGKRRVPCSVGYQITIRDNALHMTYLMRSNDFHTHWANDLALAQRLMEWFHGQLNLYYDANDQPGIDLGSMTHVVGSLHVYAKDVAHVF